MNDEMQLKARRRKEEYEGLWRTARGKLRRRVWVVEVEEVQRVQREELYTFSSTIGTTETIVEGQDNRRR